MSTVPQSPGTTHSAAEGGLQSGTAQTWPVGVIGAGNMGGAIVERLCEQGWPVLVHDIAEAARLRATSAGAEVVDSAAEIGRRANTVIVLVVDAAEVEQVLFREGLDLTVGPHTTVLLCPTLAPEVAGAVARRLDGTGARVIDAPVSGGPQRARDGTMSMMVAGDATALDALAPLLAVLSTQVFHISDRLGDAARTKLVNNLVAAINLAGAAEALALASRWGLDPAQTLAVMERSSGQSWIGSDRMGRALKHDYAPRAHTTLLAKDTRLACEAAADAQPLLLGTMVAELFRRACDESCAGLDDASLFQWFSRKTPVAD